ncbi:enoyl-CoA hydratase-related protein [Nocardioides sp. 31GB23]|uniref:enoyl-CoA hydratase-related protein n=1 Tax=Nocardioides sp. 31GB23 TaxID=3156065 RepID=UPI0032AF3CA1
MSGQVRVEVEDGVAVMTLDAPERRNALTVDMALDLIAACEKVDADPAIGAVVVTGAGSYFCAGGERATLSTAGERPADAEMFEAMGHIYQSFKRVGELLPPTVAAIRGGAVGAGMNLALATDIRIVADDARLMSGFLAIQLHPGGGHGTLLARTGAREVGNAMSLFGQSVLGSRAAELGLAWESVPADQVEAHAIELARQPAADPELARRTARSMRLQSLSDDAAWNRGLELERATQMWSMRRRHLAADL